MGRRIRRRIPLYDDAELRDPSFIWIGGDLVVNHLHDHALADGCGGLACGGDCKGAVLELANFGIAFGMRLWGRMGSSVLLDPLPEIVFGSTTNMGFRSSGERDWIWPGPGGGLVRERTTSEGAGGERVGEEERFPG